MIRFRKRFQSRVVPAVSLNCVQLSSTPCVTLAGPPNAQRLSAQVSRDSSIFISRSGKSSYAPLLSTTVVAEQRIISDAAAVVPE